MLPFTNETLFLSLVHTISGRIFKQEIARCIGGIKVLDKPSVPDLHPGVPWLLVLENAI